MGEHEEIINLALLWGYVFCLAPYRFMLTNLRTSNRIERVCTYPIKHLSPYSCSTSQIMQSSHLSLTFPPFSVSLWLVVRDSCTSGWSMLGSTYKEVIVLSSRGDMSWSVNKPQAWSWIARDAWSNGPRNAWARRDHYRASLRSSLCRYFLGAGGAGRRKREPYFTGDRPIAWDEMSGTFSLVAITLKLLMTERKRETRNAILICLLRACPIAQEFTKIFSTFFFHLLPKRALHCSKTCKHFIRSLFPLLKKARLRQHHDGNDVNLYVAPRNVQFTRLVFRD